ncbi:hypothetical protein K3888_11235 [Dietzia aurantiaca]|uniref:hypothetical protein n=1 Tax=Dietzia aurantiaca TaxID=983873 RepID=UPI001E28D041|nr:hypothetical protein [Dietzia aurantiaca]MCD2263271.1 hypothetical protein [Dietzia aurantiaca]
MPELALFDVDPWRESTAADLKVGDWIKGLGWPWSWNCVIRADHYGNNVMIDTSTTAGGSMVGGYSGNGDARVLVYNGTPPAEERAA